METTASCTLSPLGMRGGLTEWSFLPHKQSLAVHRQQLRGALPPRNGHVVHVIKLVRELTLNNDSCYDLPSVTFVER